MPMNKDDVTQSARVLVAHHSDSEIVAELHRLNPFGGYQLPRDERARLALAETLVRYQGIGEWAND